jgi:hypothetical protein
MIIKHIGLKHGAIGKEGVMIFLCMLRYVTWIDEKMYTIYCESL